MKEGIPPAWLAFLAAAVGAQPFRASGRGPDLEALLARASAYVERYEQELSSVVAEEEYLQRAIYRDAVPQQRRLRSEFLMVKLRPADPWIPFRDVFEVNGARVRDRDERLRRLFLEEPAAAPAAAARITEESARYNIGRIRRTINVPTLALTVLRPDTRPRFQFRMGRQERAGDVDAWRVDFHERQRPTIIQTSRGGDVPMSGSLWVDPHDGSVRQKRLHTEPDRVSSDILVVYCTGTLEILVPCTMTEVYRSGPDEIRAQATYSNFRRFQVLVDSRMDIKK